MLANPGLTYKGICMYIYYSSHPPNYILYLLGNGPLALAASAPETGL
jgi:hypothetical protein